MSGKSRNVLPKARQKHVFAEARTRLFDKVRQWHSAAVFGGIIRFGSKPMKVSSKSAIVFAPHQDDETFGCGGLIALKRELGTPVKVVFLTDGAGSHGGIEPHEAKRLVAVRQAEAVKAAEVLGLDEDDLLFLGYPDGGLKWVFEHEREQAIGRIAEVLRTFGPEEVYVTHRRDKHGDHEAAYQLIVAAVQRLNLSVDIFQYPIWAVWWSALGKNLHRSDLLGAEALAIGAVSEKKRKAIDVYRSQIEVLPRGFLNRFLWPHEIFFRTPSSSQPGDGRKVEQELAFRR